MTQDAIRRGFTQGDPPKVMAMILCDQVSVPVTGPQKATLAGLFDLVTLPGTGQPYGVTGFIVILLSGVREPLRVRAEMVAYPADKPEGVRHEVGTANVAPPELGTIQAAIFGPAIPIPATEPGTVELMVYCNDTWLDMRPIYVRAPEPPQGAAKA